MVSSKQWNNRAHILHLSPTMKSGNQLTTVTAAVATRKYSGGFAFTLEQLIGSTAFSNCI
jgi:hypothetical protein